MAKKRKRIKPVKSWAVRTPEGKFFSGSSGAPIAFGNKSGLELQEGESLVRVEIREVKRDGTSKPGRTMGNKDQGR